MNALEKKAREARHPPHAVAALVILRPDGRVCFVPKRGRLTFPTEHLNLDKGDRSLKDTAFRCAKEELGIDPDYLRFRADLGTHILSKASGESFLFEIFLFAVDSKAAENISFEEDGELGQTWERPRQVQEDNLDPLAKEAVCRLVSRNLIQKILSAICQLNGKKRRGDQCRDREGRRLEPAARC